VINWFFSWEYARTYRAINLFVLFFLDLILGIPKLCDKNWHFIIIHWQKWLLQDEHTWSNKDIVEIALSQKVHWFANLSHEKKRALKKPPMKYYRWLRTFKGVSKRIYGSLSNPVKTTSVGALGCMLRCVFRESDAMSFAYRRLQVPFRKIFLSCVTNERCNDDVLIPIKRHENWTPCAV